MNEIIPLPPPNNRYFAESLLAMGAPLKCAKCETQFTATSEIIPHFIGAHGWKSFRGTAG